jgi:nanoRNase/pAp phosphatase (c-di-AMP/oligoRNAs hydrolase)
MSCLMGNAQGDPSKASNSVVTLTYASKSGGGGHECASGCSLDGPLAMAVAKVVEVLRHHPSVQ